MIRSAKRRFELAGFLLVASLMISVLFLVTGLGMLSAQVSRYASAARIAEGLQAKNAALSGMEDVRVKLNKDVKFPPRKSVDKEQYKFAYSENMATPAGSPAVSYTVVIDYELEYEAQVPRQPAPNSQLGFGPQRWGVYRINVTGFYGPRAQPIAQSMFYAEYDIGTGQFIRFDDRSSL